MDYITLVFSFTSRFIVDYPVSQDIKNKEYTHYWSNVISLVQSWNYALKMPILLPLKWFNFFSILSRAFSEGIIFLCAIFAALNSTIYPKMPYYIVYSISVLLYSTI